MATNDILEVTSANDCADLTGFERAQSIGFSATEQSVEISKFAGTVLENIKLSQGYLRGSRGYNSSSEEFYTKHRVTSAYQYAGIVANNRTKVGGTLVGEGWLTSLVLPHIISRGTEVEVEVIIDGESHFFKAVQQVGSKRLYMGYAHTDITESVGSSSNIYHYLASPEIAVSKGKGVPFKESLEVWVTHNEVGGFSSTSVHAYAGFQVLLGSVDP